MNTIPLASPGRWRIRTRPATRGDHATIDFKYGDAAGMLTTGPRAGTYSGMPATRRLDVVLFGDNVGGRPGETATPTRTVDYDGTAVSVRRRR